MFSGYRSKNDIMGDTPHTEARTIAHATVTYTQDGNEIIRYQDTDILTKFKNGHMILNSGGYRTPTTKDRINNALGARGQVYQDASIWYYKPGYYSDPRPSIVFYDGIRINTKGNVTGRKPRPEKIKRQIKALKKRINVFVKLIDDLSEIPRPQIQDCLICRLFDADGNPSPDTEHLKSHIDEGCIHGSLLYNAMSEAGYRPDAHRAMNFRDSFKRTLRRYLFTRLSKEILS